MRIDFFPGKKTTINTSELKKNESINIGSGGIGSRGGGFNVGERPQVPESTKEQKVEASEYGLNVDNKGDDVYHIKGSLTTGLSQDAVDYWKKHEKKTGVASIVGETKLSKGNPQTAKVMLSIKQQKMNIDFLKDRFPSEDGKIPTKYDIGRSDFKEHYFGRPKPADTFKFDMKTYADNTTKSVFYNPGKIVSHDAFQDVLDKQSLGKFENVIQGAWHKMVTNKSGSKEGFDKLMSDIKKSGIKQHQKDTLTEEYTKKRKKYKQAFGGSDANPWETGTDWETKPNKDYTGLLDSKATWDNKKSWSSLSDPSNSFSG